MFGTLKTHYSYAWLNLSALGVLEEGLLVCVELPRDPVGAFGRRSVSAGLT